MNWKSAATWTGIAGGIGLVVGLSVSAAASDQAMQWADIVATVAGVVVAAAGAFVAGVKKAKN